MFAADPRRIVQEVIYAACDSKLSISAAITFLSDEAILSVRTPVAFRGPYLYTSPCVLFQIAGSQLLITDTLHFADVDSTSGLRHGEIVS